MNKKYLVLAAMTTMALTSCSSVSYLKLSKGGDVQDYSSEEGIASIQSHLATMIRNTVAAIEDPLSLRVSLSNLEAEYMDIESEKRHNYRSSYWDSQSGRQVYEHVYGSEYEGSTIVKGTLDGSIYLACDGVTGKSLNELNATAQIQNLTANVLYSQNEKCHYVGDTTNEDYEVKMEQRFICDDLNLSLYKQDDWAYLDASSPEIIKIYNQVLNLITMNNVPEMQTFIEYAINNHLGLIKANVGELIPDQIVEMPDEDIEFLAELVEEYDLEPYMDYIQLFEPFLEFRTYDGDAFEFKIAINKDNLADFVYNIYYIREMPVTEEEYEECRQDADEDIISCLGETEIELVLKADKLGRLDSIGVNVDGQFIKEDTHGYASSSNLPRGDFDINDFYYEDPYRYYNVYKTGITLNGKFAIDFNYGDYECDIDFDAFEEDDMLNTFIGAMFA